LAEAVLAHLLQAQMGHKVEDLTDDWVVVDTLQTL
jgi:hypothetical protein